MLPTASNVVQAVGYLIPLVEGRNHTRSTTLQRLRMVVGTGSWVRFGAADHGKRFWRGV